MKDDEDTFLSQLVARPADDELRQVYADWLLWRNAPDDLERARFLRGQPGEGPEPPGGSALDPAWIARVDRTAIEGCSVLTVAFECPRRWEVLEPTDRPRVRSCGACRQHVYHCATVSEALSHTQLGHCVAIRSTAIRRAGDLDATAEMAWMGRFLPPDDGSDR